jgi:hypothetical protein
MMTRTLSSVDAVEGGTPISSLNPMAIVSEDDEVGRAVDGQIFKYYALSSFLFH